MKTIVVGDVHGCLDELVSLVQKTGYRQGIDRLILAGDLVDRGPDSPGVVRYAMSIGAEAVMGNHDHKLLRRAKHMEKAAANPSYQIPMQPDKDQQATIAMLGEKERAWLESLPNYIMLEEYNTVVAHAGMVPEVPLEKQNERVYQMIRFVKNGTTKMQAMLMPGFIQPPDTYFWAEKWNGPFDIVFGHHVVGNTPQIWENNGHKAIGIDTGCVFYGMLTAMVFNTDGTREFVQVGHKPSFYPAELYYKETL